MARISFGMLFALLAAVTSALEAGELLRYFDGRPGLDCCLGCNSPCGDSDCANADCCSQCGSAYSQIDFLFYSRDNRTSQPVVIRVTDEGTTAPGTTVLTAGSPTFDWQPGLRALLGWQLNDCRAVEVSYFGIYNWHGTATVTGDNDLAIPGDLGLASLDLFAADRIRLDYRSTLNNVEANLLESLGGNLSLLGGFRYLSLDETFNIRSTDLDTGVSNYNIRASNNLYGGQLGARWLFTRGPWDGSITGKAGIYGNDAQQRQVVTDFPPPFVLRDTGSVSAGNVAFVGDINFSAAYFIDDVWSLHAGYNLLWIDGVALAQSQLDFSDPPSTGTAVQSGNGFFAHGLNFGLDARW